MHNWKTWFNSVLCTEQKRSMALTAAVLLIFLPLTDGFDEFWQPVFCFPSARLCSLFFGSECIATPQGYLLSNETLPVHVTKMCSAANFFILVLALMIGTVIKSVRLNDILKFLWILPLAYVITIAANSARIISGWFTGKWARHVLPESFWAGVHMGTGIVVFLTFLCVAYFLLTWRSYNGWDRTQTVDR